MHGHGMAVGVEMYEVRDEVWVGTVGKGLLSQVCQVVLTLDISGDNDIAGGGDQLIVLPCLGDKAEKVARVWLWMT